MQRRNVMVQAVPSGYAGVTPYLIIRGAARALEFYKKAFGATELMRFPGPGGTIGHAEIKIGEGVVMLADESLEMGHKSPQTTRRQRDHPDVLRCGRRFAIRQSRRRWRYGEASAQGSILRRSQRHNH